MNAARAVGLVMQRELDARRRAMLITTGVLVTLSVGIATVITITAEGGSGRLTGEEADVAVAIFGVIVLFMSIIFGGQVILMGTVEEKNSRVVEVVLGTLRPRHLLAGKVIAIGMVTFAEVALTIGTFLALVAAGGAFELPEASGRAAVITLVWLLLGFALYSTVYGAAGAMVRSHENPANAAGPLNLVVGIGYMIGLISASSGENLVLRIASLLPPTAPITMPVRMVWGEAAMWEIVLSMALVAVSAYGLIRLAGRAYAGALLRTGKVRWREAWRAAGDIR